VAPAKPMGWQHNWTAISLLVKSRDKQCLITRSVEYVTTAHVVPKEENVWVCRLCSFSPSHCSNL
jgi:hypothetical protein